MGDKTAYDHSKKEFYWRLACYIHDKEMAKKIRIKAVELDLNYNELILTALAEFLGMKPAKPEIAPDDPRVLR